jgi:hypothetical protein
MRNHEGLLGLWAAVELGERSAEDKGAMQAPVNDEFD